MVRNTPRPPNETERLAALRKYDILDTLPEVAFDEVTRLVGQICEVPVALISFVDEHRLWFKSRVGLDVTELPRDHGMCAYAILQSGLLVVEDALQDGRFRDSPLVAASPGIRFYAGAALISREGHPVGVLCVLDRQPRSLSPLQAEALTILARQVMAQLELRRNFMELAHNVEEHKRIEAQLRTSEVFYHALVESLPQHILRKDRQGRFTFANRRFCELLGRPLGEIEGKTDRDFFPRELADKYHRDDLRVMAARQSLDTIEAHITPKGEKKYVHVIKNPLYDAQGEVVGIQGIFWDVTERKQVEEELAYERELLRSLLDNTPDRIFFKDTESRFIRCSASMAKRLGLSHPKLVVGKTDFDFYPREQAQEFYADEQKILLTRQPLINKFERRVTPDGQEVWSSVTKVPIHGQSGAIAGIIGISRDVTALKQAEAALEHARDAALESARIKSQFLANISHEIRTPMHAITGMTDLLSSTRLTPEQREYVDTTHNSTATLLAIINDILDYSKLEAGKLTIEQIDFDLCDAVENTVGMLAEQAHRKGLELACAIDHGLPSFLRGDPGRFRQVLINLATNAIKFTERGEVVVRVSKLHETQEQVRLHVAVKDTGVGIPESAIGRIFEAFTQADGSTTRRFGGTGLGLTISRQLVEMMGGEIGAQSVVGQGSTFWFNVPFAKQAAPTRSAWSVAPEKLAGLRVLGVTDSSTLREILNDHFQYWHMQPVKAASFADAVRLLQEASAAGQPFDFVVVNRTLADVDGLSLAQRIHEDASLGGPRAILLVSLGRRPPAAALQAAGVAACLFKPVWQARLAQCLTEVLESRSVQTGPAPPEDRAQSETAPPQPPPHVPMVPVRLLLAEDNVVNQQVVLRQLRKLGFQADTVSNGAEVMAAVQRSDYDVILMDCQMPELDGYEVTRRIRQAARSERGAGPPRPYIIALTAHALVGDRERCLAAGMNDYLTKPLQLPALQQALQRAQQSVPPPSAAPASSGGTGTAPSANAPLDSGVLESLRSLREPGQPDPLKELGELFLRDTRPRLEKLESAVAEKNGPKVAGAAHAIKGSASNIGACRLAGLCAALEKNGRAGNLTDAASILLNVKSEFHLVEETLVTEMQK